MDNMVRMEVVSVGTRLWCLDNSLPFLKRRQTTSWGERDNSYDYRGSFLARENWRARGPRPMRCIPGNGMPRCNGGYLLSILFYRRIEL